MPEQPQFGKLRNFLWPIARYEFKKFIPMIFLIFLISANYNILKIIKDSTVIPVVGADAIPYIKVWLMLPVAVLMTAFFSYIVQVFDENKAFYIIISTFLAFFTVFVLIIYPNKEYFYFDSLANYFGNILPLGAKGLIAVVRYWHLCIFYTMCEIWGTTVLFVLFWGFANRVTQLNEAKRFYPLFGLAGNSSGIFAPLFFSWASQKNFDLGYFKSDWEQTLLLSYVGISISAVLTMSIYFIANKYIFARRKQESFTPKEKLGSTKKPKPFFESLRMLVRIPYVRNITIIVLSYNIVINLTEVLWKSQIKALYPNSIEYGLYFGKVMMMTGVIATISDLVLCSNLIRRFGWTTAAMITPMILLLTSIGFFGILIFDSFFESVLVHVMGVSPLVLAAFFGSAQNALSRASKYSLFDATKEISFIPLDMESRIQSKAAIDGVCSRVGKSGGSVIYQVLMLFTGGLSACIPHVAAIVAAIIFFWFSSVLQIGKKFKLLTEKKSQLPSGHSSSLSQESFAN